MAKTSPGGGVSTDKRVARWIKGLALSVLCLSLLVTCVVSGSGDDTGAIVSGPTPTERNDTVALLRQATRDQGICYGWRLENEYGFRVVSEGSNLGDNVPVSDDPTVCQHWVVVISQVTYTSDSSELSDYAITRIATSPDLARVDFLSGLARFGIDEAAFVDEPGWAICRAAVVLPLLAAESQAAAPAPPGTVAPTSTPTTTPARLPAAGSDMWRDRWGYLVGGAVILVFAVLLLVIGVFERRHSRRSAAVGAPGGTGPDGGRVAAGADGGHGPAGTGGHG